MKCQQHNYGTNYRTVTGNRAIKMGKDRQYFWKYGGNRLGRRNLKSLKVQKNNFFTRMNTGLIMYTYIPN